MKKPRAAILAAVVALALLLAACVPGDGKNTPEKPAGFWTGVWHGWVAPVSLIVGLFKKGVRIYEVNNTGWWYDAGFYIAIIAGFGGLALTRSRVKK